MPHGIVVGNDDMIAAWAFSTFNLHPTKVDKAFGIIDKDKKVVGAILFQNFNGANVELSYYGPHTLTAGIVRIIARMAIGHFNVSRGTVVTSKRNRRLIQSLLRAGFRLEGIQRCFYGREDNRKNTGVRLVMFRDQIDRIASGKTAAKMTQQV